MFMSAITATYYMVVSEDISVEKGKILSAVRIVHNWKRSNATI